MGLSWTGGGNLTPGNIRSRNREMKAGKRDLTVIGCRRKQSVEGGGSGPGARTGESRKKLR